jgi:hypothetical protein
MRYFFLTDPMIFLSQPLDIRVSGAGASVAGVVTITTEY